MAFLTFLLWAILIGAGLYALAFLWVFLSQTRLTYLPSRTLWRTPSEVKLPYEDVSLITDDGVRIHGWFIPAADNRGTVLFFHGNAGNIAHQLETVLMLRNWHLNTLVIDYRGYGKSEGRPSAIGTGRDADAAWRFLVEEKKLSEKSIIVFGRSLGAAVAADLVARVQPAGAILESGFTSLPDIAAHLYPWLPVRLLARNRYPSLENITRFRCPVLIAHSREDDLIPFSHGEQLFQAAPEPRFFLEMIGTHQHCVTTTGMSYERAVRSFIDDALLTSSSKSRE